jgi:Fic family protein
MRWNWEQPEWPDFSYAASVLEPLEKRFLFHSGEFIGAFGHLSRDDRDILRIELVTDEAVKTSEIEGEILDRDSVQSSLRHAFGLESATARAAPAARGVAEMMADLYRTFAAPLTHEAMFGWHRQLMRGQRSVGTIGGYRTHAEAMQVVSGPIHKRKIHFEAPPSIRVGREMDGFVAWFNASATSGPRPLPALTRASIAHLYFESIHPFEDGNGRIGRALSEKTLAQNLGQPTLIALAYTIARARQDYYAALERGNKETEITDWLVYFAETVLKAQDNTIGRVGFHIAKAKLYESLRGQLNERQKKVVARMFREGVHGFKGGLSAENYIAIARTSRATATRDLQDLVNKGALTRTGELRHTRYHLNVAGIAA